ncbi:hypothetical protein [Rubritepida flocculans]|jgi:hypothetical protein|uniref:hypothetical protein n=1 Tax=Rubritepida flocculans TaxID=182403 RepID=UPI00040F3FC1|nr:hypothetical protein [Rubritepida flocculans]
MSETRREVTLAGRLIGLSILGSTVIFVIALEAIADEAALSYVKYILAGALALAIAVPLIFFRRPVPVAARR